MVKKIWLITGISSGLGKALARSVIDNGDFVIGSFRSQIQTDVFNNQYKDKAFALILVITKPNEINKAFKLIKVNLEKLMCL